MRGNSAILKCSIPSFVADFVHVVAWIDEDDNEIVTSNDFTGGKEFNLNPSSFLQENPPFYYYLIHSPATN